MKTSRKIELVVIYLLWYVSHLSRENKPTLKEFIKTGNDGKSITVGDLVKLGIPIFFFLTMLLDFYIFGFNFDRATYSTIVASIFGVIILVSILLYCVYLYCTLYDYLKKNWNKEVKLN